MLAHGDVVLQVLFMHATKGAQKIAHGSPSAFARVGGDFVNAAAVLITRPFLLSVTHPSQGCVANGGNWSIRRCNTSPLLASPP